MKKVRDESAKSDARFQELALKSRRIRWEADDLEEEIRILQAGSASVRKAQSRDSGWLCFDLARFQVLMVVKLWRRFQLTKKSRVIETDLVPTLIRLADNSNNRKRDETCEGKFGKEGM